MTDTDHDQARRDVRRRQREVSNRTVFANGARGTTFKEVNAALAETGLPTLANADEWQYLDYDVPP